MRSRCDSNNAEIEKAAARACSCSSRAGRGSRGARDGPDVLQLLACCLSLVAYCPCSGSAGRQCQFSSATLRPQTLSTAADLLNSQEFGTDSFCTSRRFGGWDSDRIGNSHSEFSELAGPSRIPELSRLTA